MNSNIKLFNTEKEAQEFSDKNFDSKGIPYEITFENSIVFALVFPHDIDADYENDNDLFLGLNNELIERHYVKTE